MWGEIGRFIATCKYPLVNTAGGPLIINHMDIRKARDGRNGISYLWGLVSEKGEGMAGHHAEKTLCIVDEASGVDDEVYEKQQGWAKRFLAIGNPNPCQNFYYKLIKEGDILATP